MRRGVVVGAATIGGLLVAGLWLSGRPALTPEATIARSAPVTLRDMARSIGRVASPSGSASQAPVGSAEPTDCGLPGASSTPGDSADAGSLASDEVLDAARHEAIARLGESADPAQRAAGLLLENRIEQVAALRTCADEAACIAAAVTRSTPAVDRLAVLARMTDSAAAYAMAFQACGRGANRPAISNFCAGLSAERWAQLAPQSAWPWLGLADEARTRADVSGVEYAINRAAHATDWRAAGAGFAALVIDALPADLPAAPRLALSLDALGVEYGLFGAVQGLVTYCPATAEPGRRQNCIRLAERMLDRTDNLIGLQIAIRLGERAGVAESRLAGFRAELESLRTMGPMANLLAESGPTGSGCADLARAAAGFERQARLGELATLRARRAESASPGGSR